MLLEAGCRSGCRALIIDIINVNITMVSIPFWEDIIKHFIEYLASSLQGNDWRYILMSSDKKCRSNKGELIEVMELAFGKCPILPREEVVFNTMGVNYISINHNNFIVVWDFSSSYSENKLRLEASGGHNSSEIVFSTEGVGCGDFNSFYAEVDT